jgi:aryl-alcohol dehydrogenase-like predicted oxidoreductase
MRMRSFGRLGRVSALTLGGGGIGNVWGAVDRAEAVATVRAALAAGITMLDVAPTYGRGEAEMVVGEALDGTVPEGMLITTKVGLPDAKPEAVEDTIVESLRSSMQRLGVEHIDLLLLHTQLEPQGGPYGRQELGVELFRGAVRPVFEQLRNDDLIRGWGLTGVGHPRALKDVLCEEPRPDAIQCVTNALDLTGNIWAFGADVRPDNAAVRACAVQAGVQVIGVRAVAAGALTDAIDRPVEADEPTAHDYEAAAGFRRMAAERGESAAYLAHRYALSIPDVATVVLGVKNRAELEECLAAEAAEPLADHEMRAIEALRGA